MRTEQTRLGKCAVRGSAGSARRIIAGVLLCLCFLQALGLSVSSNLQHGSFNVSARGFVAATGGLSCVAHADDDAPNQEHRDHAQCCVFCATSGRDALLLLVFAFLTETAFLTPEKSPSVVGFLLNDMDEHPLGWASSWSSRAPPSIS
jgi:hypothetical protein